MNPQRITPLLLILSLPASGLLAQETEQKEEEVVELSPFVVSADSEVGYVATETLSGTRIRSNLGEVGASLDVLTSELLEDIGANDATDALDLSGNVTTWDKSGDQDAVQNQIWFSNPYNSRGFLSTSVLADFFELGVQPLDFYSFTRLTIAKGPNAVLYGIGSPGGVLSLERKKARFGKDTVELQVQTDSEESFRSTLDVSREVIEDKLAFRTGALYFDKKEFLEPAGLLRKGVFGTLTWRPSRKTSATLFLEKGNEKRIFRYGWVSYDWVTPWIEAGRPTYANVGDPLDASPGTGLDRDGKLTVHVQGQPEIEATTWRGMARGEANEIPGHPDINETRIKSYTEDNAIYDVEGLQLMGDGLKRDLEWQDFMVNLQHQILPNLNIELAYNRNWTKHRTVQAFPGGQLRIDPNEVLPNGAPNPNFLSTYIETTRTEVVGAQNTADTYRATVTYELDLRDRKLFGRIPVGRLNLVGMIERRDVRSLFAGFRRVNTTPSLLGNFPGDFPNDLRDWSNKLSTRAYIRTDLTPDGAFAIPYYQSNFDLIDDPGVTSGWIRHTSPRDIDEVRETYLLAAQYFTWQAREGYERLILTAGIRDDKSSSRRTTFPFVDGNIYAGENFRGSPWDVGDKILYDGTFNYGTKDPKEVTDEDPTSTYSVVFRLNRNWMVFYNFSDVLISSSALFKDIYGNAPPPTLGETHDFGIRANLLNDKLNASLTFFETSAVNQRESNIRGQMTNWINDMWDIVDPSLIIEEERWVTFRDDQSEGLEFSLVGNPLPGWNLRLIVSRIETTIDSRLPVTDRYIAQYLPTWEANRDAPLDDSVSFSEYQTVGDAIDRLQAYVTDIHATEGIAPRVQREWKVILNSVYTVREGPLKRLAIGGGFRWQDEDVLGFAIDENDILDPNRPFRGEEIFVMNAMLRYPIFLGSKTLVLQLNVDNLLDDRGTFPRRAIDDLSGNPYFTAQQMKAPRSFTLMATLRW
ncbi:TonB-dependent receptor plug domain-containing protein [Puniceicoccales bacterium CK1056]|uniref:TonB-dependent receptor plug domain-containing protein n=1 Tax=Oceanipulchritudo coccoides TaxID=2706888 RepID=A0A6B2LZR0_9BACT|nr:TonB-dependent receptor plug domain-containing protein [Oceanipulchritudo coccoides]NDV61556.1 TonB-dependent receptor plug domain-containing protein [Oceanipulchritudo coccoides]